MQQSHPLAELPIKNHKYVKNCLELYMGKRSIEEIANFEEFVNLEVLWINDNKIEKLEGLDSNFRIKYLYAQNNRIRSLNSSSLHSFKFLHELRLYGNKLDNLQETLSVLGRLQHLRDLDLFGNPLEEEENYRLHVIHAIPSLAILDRHIITAEERQKAEIIRSVKRSSTATKVSTNILKSPSHRISGAVRMLFKEVSNYNQERKRREKDQEEQNLQQLSSQYGGVSMPSCKISKQPPLMNSTIGCLQEWELVGLKSFYQSIKDPSISSLAEIFQYLTSRGYNISWNDSIISYDLFDIRPVSPELLNIFNEMIEQSPAKSPKFQLDWPGLLKILQQTQLKCLLMPSKELKKLSEEFFEKSNSIQRRSLALLHDNERCKVLVKQAHYLAQKAYYFQTLADRNDFKSPEIRDTVSNNSKESNESFHSGQKTRFSWITQGRMHLLCGEYPDLTSQRGEIDDFDDYIAKKTKPKHTATNCMLGDK